MGSMQELLGQRHGATFGASAQARSNKHAQILCVPSASARYFFSKK
jgi:hypothetical protein